VAADYHFTVTDDDCAEGATVAALNCPVSFFDGLLHESAVPVLTS
jgi:hypothetical protein